MMTTGNKRSLLAGFVALACLQAAADESPASAEGTAVERNFTWGVSGGLGAFGFRNSLYVDKEPDAPGNLGENWAEFYIKPWANYERKFGEGVFFAKGSWAGVKTGQDAADIAGGGGSSTELDELYVGYRGTGHWGLFEIAGGRYAYELGHGFLLSDGYADGGSRGGYWSNPRTAWAPAARIHYSTGTHSVSLFYLDRDERPESDARTSISGVNYEWNNKSKDWTLGASYFGLNANEIRGQLDGARVVNLRAFGTLSTLPMNLEAEWAREQNDELLDSYAWYASGTWSWADSRWRPSLQYRYAVFQGDNPSTTANEGFDPLFPGFKDWGTWWQGEIAGEYFLSNSNLRSHMLKFDVRPNENITTGLLFFDYRLDQPGSYEDGVASRNLGQEINWYMDWRAFENFSFTFVVAHNQPGAAVEEAHDRTKGFKYAMIYVSFNVGN